MPFRRCYQLFALLMLWVLTPLSSFADKNKMHIAYISLPHDAEFWTDVREFLKEVAHDLDVELSIIDHEANFPRIKELKQLINSKNKPDYLMFHYFSDIGGEILSIANEGGVKSFTVISDDPSSNKDLIGIPRKKFSNWIGHMSPDNIDGGYQLAESLTSVKPHPFKKVKLISVNGPAGSAAMKQRGIGLELKIKNTENVEHLRNVNTTWSQSDAEYAISHLLKQSPDISHIWTGTYGIAQAAITASRKHGLKPGKDVFIGGFDWTRQSIESIRNGSLHVMLGGHSMVAGWALILLYDHYHGIDFKDELGTDIKSPLLLMTKENADQYTKVFQSEKWKMYDYSMYSKQVNSNNTRYNFSIEKIYQTLEVE